VVATLPPGRYAPAIGHDEAEVEVIATPARLSDFEELSESPSSAALVITAGKTPKSPSKSKSKTRSKEREAATALAERLGGQVVDAAHAREARLAVSLGPPLGDVLAEVRVALGNPRTPGAHYAVEGEPLALARALAAALTGAKS
jgi:hypothetical protein